MSNKMTNRKTKKTQSCKTGVNCRYSDADIFRFSDGWWITRYSKSQKRFIKLIGSFKTKDEARAEICVLNDL